MSRKRYRPPKDKPDKIKVWQNPKQYPSNKIRPGMFVLAAVGEWEPYQKAVK